MANINTLKGAQSNNEYRISGFSSMPSFGPLISSADRMPTLYTKLQKYSLNEYIQQHKLSQDSLFSGFGIYADYKNKAYYYYFASLCNVKDGKDFSLFIQFLPMNDNAKKRTFPEGLGLSLGDPSSAYTGTLKIFELDENKENCYSNGEIVFEGISSSREVYLCDYAALAAYQYGPYYEDEIKGASLGFWLFDSTWDNTCFMEGTKVRMADNTFKNIEDVKVHDVVKFISDNGEEKTTEVVLPPETFAEYTSNYIIYSFDDGTKLDIYGDQKIWDEDIKDYSNIHSWKIGKRTKKFNGQIVTLTERTHVELKEPKKHYFLQTWNGNYCVNDFLTYTSQDTIWENLSKEENRQYWKSEDEMKKQKRKVLTRRYTGTPMNYSAFKRLVLENEMLESSFLTSIKKNKQYLSETDYVAIKHAEDEISNEEYLPVKAKRSEARLEINNAEEKIVTVNAEKDAIIRKIKAKKDRPRDSSQSGDSLVLLSDGTTKMLKDIKVGDMVAFLNTDNELVGNRVMLPVEPELVWDYTLIKLENGAELKLSGQRLIFNATKNRWCHQKVCDVNDELLLSDGTKKKIISKETVNLDDPEEFYRLNTYYAQYILNGVSLKTGTMRNYEELMYDEHAFWRLSDSEMATWKKWCEDNKDV